MLNQTISDRQGQFSDFPPQALLPTGGYCGASFYTLKATHMNLMDRLWARARQAQDSVQMEPPTTKRYQG